MAWAEKISNSKPVRYRGGWRDVNGRKHYTRRPEFPLHPYSRRSDALKAAQEAEVKAQRVAAVDYGTLSADITWGDWWDQSRPLRPDSDTGKTETRIAQKYIRPKWGDIPLNKIARKAVQRWVTDDLLPGKSRSYARRIYGVFQASLNRAVEREVLGASPCVKITLPRARKRPLPYVDQPHLEALTQPMADRLPALSDPGHRALVAVAYETGLRPGELCGMHVGQVDVKTGWVEVTHVRIRHAIRAWPKDEDSRSVPLTATAAEILRRLIAERTAQGCGVPHTDGSTCRDDLVFRTLRGIPITPGALNKAMERAAVTLGVRNTSPYALRRGAATWMAEAGVDAFTIAAIFGHEDVTLTTGYVQRTSAARDKLRAARGEGTGLTVIEGSKESPPDETGLAKRA